MFSCTARVKAHRCEGQLWYGFRLAVLKGRVRQQSVHGGSSFMSPSPRQESARHENYQTGRNSLICKKIFFMKLLIWTGMEISCPRRRHRRGWRRWRRRRLREKIRFISIFFAVYIEVLMLQKRQTYQKNLHSKPWNMGLLPKSSKLKKLLKNLIIVGSCDLQKKFHSHFWLMM